MDSFQFNIYGRSPVSRPVLGPNSEDREKKKKQENEQVVKDQRSQWEPRVKKLQNRCKSGKWKEFKTISQRKIIQVLTTGKL